MAQNSKIEWTNSTWNPITGCTKISDGCLNCYAFRMANRLQAMNQPKYSSGFKVCLHEESLEEPLRIKKPSMIFVNSMSDIFHADVPLSYIQKIFAVMKEANWHTFQLLTKRADRLAQLSSELDWPSNVWQGVSVESHKYVDRIECLKQSGAVVKFISFEPLIGAIGSVNLTGINWAIVGGESGPKARKMDEAWVIEIKQQCEKQSVSFYFKQWGGTNKKKNGRLLLGKTWDDMPATNEIA